MFILVYLTIANIKKKTQQYLIYGMLARKPRKLVRPVKNWMKDSKLISKACVVRQPRMRFLKLHHP
ncbi:hypothetical protein EcCFBP13530_04390 [Enterobacter cancerogenus]|uniref:Uncharacterized protein n=1 Tax=Enterobacter cancerogenus TaxID=69218 RepID=A0AB38PA72_9ENTR|nr:hypothetical protein EcCFBP13530_04390 [Enterobacter cancerogenus]